MIVRPADSKFEDQLTDETDLEYSIRQEHGVLLTGCKQLGKMLLFLQRTARKKSGVLLLGEPGTGKEGFARIVWSFHKGQCNGTPGPYVPINCATLDEGTSHSELFGHEKGAFTGADTKKEGRLLDAHPNGVAFLDEAQGLPGQTREQLLRVLDGEPFYRMGGNASNRSQQCSLDNVRFVMATSKSPEKMRERFGTAILSRMSTKLHIPPLRERDRAYKTLLIEYLCERKMIEYKFTQVTFEQDALDLLLSTRFDGNVRGIEHVIENSLLYCAEGENPEVVVSAQAIKEVMEFSFIPEAHPTDKTGPLTLKEIEKNAIRAALIRNNWHVKTTAAELEMAEKTLYTKINVYKLREEKEQE